MGERAVMEWSWQVLERVLQALVSAYGWGAGLGAYVPRTAWRHALSELRLIEAAARRLLVAMAAGLSAGTRTAPARPGPAPALKPPRTRAEPRPASPAFPYGEALADPLAGLFPGAPAPLRLPPPCLPALVPADALARRLAALSRLLADPQRAARHMARRLARRKGGARQPFRLWKRPGAGLQRRGDFLDEALRDAHALAISVLNRGPPGEPQPQA